MKPFARVGESLTSAISETFTIIFIGAIYIIIPVEGFKLVYKLGSLPPPPSHPLFSNYPITVALKIPYFTVC